MENITINGVEYTPLIKEERKVIPFVLEQILKFEVGLEDFSILMNWKDAQKACQDLGDGWRLPTKDELNLMYKNKDKVGNFADNDYWSSSEDNDYYAWIQYFSNGKQYAYNEGSRCNVRAVRNFK